MITLKSHISATVFLISSGFFASYCQAASLDDQKTEYGHSIVIKEDASDDHTFLISADGNKLLKEDGEFSVSIEGMYLAGNHVYGIIGDNNGGTACPLMYRFIYFSPDGPSISKQFGTCSDLPKITTHGDNLRISMPGSDGPDKRNIYTIKENSIYESIEEEKLGNDGPELTKNMNLESMVVGKDITTVLKTSALMTALKKSTPPSDLKTVLYDFYSGPSVDFTRSGNYAVSMACSPHQCGSNEASMVVSSTGYVWTAIMDETGIHTFGNPPPEADKVLRSAFSQ